MANQTKFVTQEQFDAATAEFFEESPDHVLVETPAGDSKLAEELLGLEGKTFQDFTCRFAKGTERCSKCNRHFSILDFMVTALQVHTKEFLAHHIFETEEYTLTRGGRTPTCYDCGEKGRDSTYTKRNSYSCVEFHIFDKYAGTESGVQGG